MEEAEDGERAGLQSLHVLGSELSILPSMLCRSVFSAKELVSWKRLATICNSICSFFQLDKNGITCGLVWFYLVSKKFNFPLFDSQGEKGYIMFA